MPVLDAIERGALFRLTRFLTLLTILSLSVVIAVGCAMFASDFIPTGNAHISYYTLAREINPTPNASAPERGQEATANDNTSPIPAALRQYFDTPARMEVLSDQLAHIDVEDRADYLKNLAEVLSDAKPYHADTPELIDAYFADKSTELNAAKSRRGERTTRQLAIAGSFVSCLVLIAMASLILVLLAIERNTRPNTSVGAVEANAPTK